MKPYFGQRITSMFAPVSTSQNRNTDSSRQVRELTRLRRARTKAYHQFLVSSTLRFWARPRGVSLAATGWVAP
jgi:hypothetical protein